MFEDKAPGYRLTDASYHSLAADRAYMSCSQYDSFRSCEARESAYLRGAYKKPKTENAAFLVGSYFHAAMEGPEAFERFKDGHWNEIYRTASKEKNREFEQADRMVSAVLQDPGLSRLHYLPGERELIMAGVLFSAVPWKVKLDKYCTEPARIIMDYKTCADVYEEFYVPGGGREGFVEHWGYDRRAAVYLEVERQHSKADSYAGFYIIAVSKQSPPGKELISMNGDAGSAMRLASALAGMEEGALRYQGIKDGLVKPRRCERCDYCRSTKKVTAPKLYTEIGRDA